MPEAKGTRNRATKQVEPRSERTKITDLIAACSIETVARAGTVDEICRAGLPAGTKIFITFLPNDTLADRVAAAKRLRRANLDPVPHLAARQFVDHAQLDDCLARLAGDAAVDRVLVIGGDVDRPRGTFASSLELIETGLLERRGIRHVGIAAYPEAHPRIAEPTLEQALSDKLARLGAAGVSPFIVTQFCFEAAPIIDWIERHRAATGDAPIYIGLAGPASAATLMRYAAHCGVGRSLRAAWRDTYWARILIRPGPESVLRDLAARSDIMAQIGGLHFFTFGGIGKTCAWLAAAARDGLGASGQK